MRKKRWRRRRSKGESAFLEGEKAKKTGKEGGKSTIQLDYSQIMTNFVAVFKINGFFLKYYGLVTNSPLGLFLGGAHCSALRLRHFGRRTAWEDQDFRGVVRRHLCAVHGYSDGSFRYDWRYPYPPFHIIIINK